MRLSFLLIIALFFAQNPASAQISTFPYTEDFEGGAGGWFSGGTNNDWALGTPAKPVINGAGSGASCWVTGGLTNPSYANGERSWVESPVFNFTNLPRPLVSFKIFWETEFMFDGGGFQYSISNGPWLNVGTVNDMTCFTEGWFNLSPINFLSGLANPQSGWSGNIQPTMGNCQGGAGSGGWLDAQHCLTGCGGQANVRLRFIFGAGTTCNAFDGFAFDLVHVENAPPPVVDFTAECTGSTFSFMDNSSPCINGWTWNFGDPASGANNISTLQNPMHTFNTAGNFTVTHNASNLCGGGATPVIQVVTILGATAMTTPVGCNGGSDGSATLTTQPTGIVPTIEWGTSPPQTGLTATGLEAGTYDVTITAPNACPKIMTVTINEPPPLNHVVNITPASCNSSNGAATVVVTGGSPAYQYGWSPAGGPGPASNGLPPGNYTVLITDSHGCTDEAEFTITSSNGVNAVISSSINVNCNGGNTGSATATGTGGAMPYTYLWSNAKTTQTITGLTAGTYSVTMTDNSGCTSIASIIITQPPAMAHSVAIQQAACGMPTGSATVTETGGTPGYAYIWSPSGGSAMTATGLAPGNYIVSITDIKGCIDTAHVAILSAAGPTVLISNTVNINCFGGNNGSATATATGGTAPISYKWSSGAMVQTAQNLTAGQITVTVTDANGCTATATANIIQPTAMAHSVTTVSATCGAANGSASVSETGGSAPYDFFWTPSGGTNSAASNLSPGNYIVFITDQNGCIDSAHVLINNIGAPTAAISNFTNIPCFGQNNGTAMASATGGIAPLTFLWSNGQSGATATNLSPGNVVVTVTDANGCTTSVSQNISQPTAMAHITASQSAACGVANGSATVTESGGIGPYSYQWSPTGGTNSTATNLPAGIYIVSVNDQNGCLDTAVVTVANPTGLSLNITGQTNIDCFGNENGAATVAASNGNLPYLFTWNTSLGSGTSANNLPAGIYGVTVTDATSCSATAAISISQPVEFQHFTTVSPASCGQSNGSATVNMTGGTGAITYSWSPSGGSQPTANGLAPGNFTLSITDQSGCTDTVQVQITNSSGPSVLISNTVSVKCFGENNGSATATVSGGTAPVSINWSNAATGPNALNLPAGNIAVTVTDALGCTATVATIITQPADLQHIATANAATCGANNGSASIAETGGTGAYIIIWSPSGGSSLTASGLSPGNFIVSITDQNGCADTVHVKIENEPGPSASLFNNIGVKCFGGSNGSVSALSIGGFSPIMFNWSNGSTVSTAINLPAGQVTVTVSDGNGCTATATANITQPAVLNNTSTTTNTTCGAANGSATILQTGGTTPYSYVWSPSGGTNATANNLAANNYTVSITDGNGCKDTAFVSIVNQNGAVASISSTQNLDCFGGNNGSATALSTGGPAPISYKWSNGNTGATATNLPAGLASVTITDGNGCTAIASATLTQPTKLTHTTTAVTATCGNANGSATILENGGTPPYSFAWAPTGGTNSTATNLLPGNYVVNILDANGCKDSVHVQILNVAGPTALISTTIGANCFGQNNGTATAAQTGGKPPFTYQWPNNQTTATATGLAAGQFTVTVADANGCTATATATIAQPTVLGHTISTQNVTCVASNGSASFTATGGTGPYSFAWLPNVSTTSSAQNLAVGNYSVTISDAKGCTNVVVFIIQQATPIVIDIVATQPKCFNSDDGILTANATGGAGNYMFIWSNSLGGNSIFGLPIGQYSVTATDASGCTVVAGAVLSQIPILSEWAVENAICFGEKTGSISLDTTIGGAAPYTYSIDIQTFTTDPDFYGLAAGPYVALTKDANGCTAFNSLSITEPAYFSIDAGIDTFIILGNDVRLEAIASDPSRVVKYAWSPPPIDCDSCAVTIAQPLNSATYSIIITDENGCTAIATREIMVRLSPVYIPTAFSPNFDGDNDGFTVFGGAGIAEIEFLRVFDRWGDLVFENTNFQPSDPSIGWNGTVRGKDSEVAVYVYVAKVKFINGASVIFKGDVTAVK